MRDLLQSLLGVGCIMSSLFQSLELLSHVLHLPVFMGLNQCLWLDYLVLALPRACFPRVMLRLRRGRKVGHGIVIYPTLLLVCFHLERPGYSYVMRGKGSQSYSMVRTPWIWPHMVFSVGVNTHNCSYCQFYIPLCLLVNLYRWIWRWNCNTRLISVAIFLKKITFYYCLVLHLIYLLIFLS